LKTPPELGNSYPLRQIKHNRLGCFKQIVHTLIAHNSTTVMSH